MKQIVSGVEYLHDEGILHRDIKLGNILMKGDTVKIADFGLAISFHDNEVPRSICGTPNFLAPEVYRIKLHSTASDIWAVGCVLFSLLAGENPFPYSGMPATGERIMRMDYTIPIHVTDHSRDTIQSLLEEDYTK